MHDRSPVHFIDRVRGAVLLLQGLDDPVVPASQAEMMFAALKNAGVPAPTSDTRASSTGSGRRRTSPERSRRSCYFFATVTGMTLAESIVPVEILNL